MTRNRWREYRMVADRSIAVVAISGKCDNILDRFAGQVDYKWGKVGMLLGILFPFWL